MIMGQATQSATSQEVGSRVTHMRDDEMVVGDHSNHKRCAGLDTACDLLDLFGSNVGEHIQGFGDLDTTLGPPGAVRRLCKLLERLLCG